MSDHLKGLLITITGILALCPDSLIVRLIEADQWTLLFWRGIFTGTGIALFSALYHGRNASAAFQKIGMPGVLMAFIFTGSTIFFVTALHYTSVANTLVITGTAPIFAALLSRVFLSEPVSLRTWVTIVVVICAVSLIVYESFGGGTLWGDICALITAISVAGTFVITRQSKGHDMTPAMALSGLVTALCVLPFATPFEVSADTMKLLLLLGFFLTAAFGLLTIGPRFIPAPEVTMLLSLETVFGVFLVWYFLGEEPTINAIIGGTIVVLTLSVHSAMALRKQ